MRSPRIHTGLGIAAVLGVQLLVCFAAAPSKTQSIDGLIRKLYADELYEREAAVGRLAKIGKPAVDKLLAALKHDDTARGFVADALGMIGDPRAVRPLLQVLAGELTSSEEDPTQDGPPNHFSDIFNALGQIGGPAVPELLIALQSRQPSVREGAACALSIIKDPSTADALVRALERCESGDVGMRVYITDALEEIGKPAVVPLIRALKSKKRHVREEATSALGRLRDGRAAEALAVALKDQDDSVRYWAATALAALDDPRAVEPLAARIDATEDEWRWSAAEALGDMDNELAAPPLLRALEQRKVDIVGAAHRFYIRKNVPGAEPLLLKAFKTRGGDQMAEAFKKSGNDVLIKAAREFEEEQRRDFPPL